MDTFSLFYLFLLAIVGFIAGAMDALAGGGGLITVPVLMSIGLPPAVALGTNRLQACMGELTAAHYFLRHGYINFHELITGLIFVVLGSSLGTWTIQVLHPDRLKKIIPFLMLVILGYVFYAPKLVTKKASVLLSPTTFYLLFGFLIGFYNGFFGPGTGTLWVIVFMIFLQFNIQKATMYTKPLNSLGNLTSLFWFVLGGHVVYPIALCMGAGQILGAHLGARLVVYKGARWIRPLFLGVVILMTIKLFLQGFHLSWKLL